MKKTMLITFLILTLGVGCIHQKRRGLLESSIQIPKVKSEKIDMEKEYKIMIKQVHDLEDIVPIIIKYIESNGVTECIYQGNSKDKRKLRYVIDRPYFLNEKELEKSVETLINCGFYTKMKEKGLESYLITKLKGGKAGAIIFYNQKKKNVEFIIFPQFNER